MAKFFRFFAERHLLATLLTVSIILMGLATFSYIKRDSFPSVEFGEVIITTHYPGASPEDVELKVTNQIEKELKEIDGIKRLASWSQENLSMIYIVIDPDAKDEDKVVREIREAVARVTDLPSEVTESPLVNELSTGVFPIIEIGLSGDLPYRELREVARRFENKLENVPGVSSVERFGYRAREIRIEVAPQRLKHYEIPLREVINAIASRNIRATGGSFESYVGEKNIVTLAQFRDPLEAREAIVRATFDGPLIKIKDLATVSDDFEEERVISRIGGRTAISFIAHKTEGADIIRTVDAIKALAEAEKAYLPEGVDLLFFNDQSTYVSQRLSIVINNGLIGLALVLLVLSLFLNTRIAFWVALGVPVTLLGVIFLLPIFDTFLDSVTLTAMVLVIGIVVDDAIIISENIYRYYEMGLKPLDAAVKGITGVIQPVLTTVLTTFVAFVPLFFMPGMLGKFVYVIPLAITLALAVSLTEASLALPAHLAASLSRRPRDGANRRERWFDAMRIGYQGIVARFLRWRYPLALAFLIVLGATLGYAYKFMDFVLFPSATADRFVILLESPIGSSLKATSDKAREIEAILDSMKRDELESYATRVGTFGDIGSTENAHHAALYVSLTPFSTRTRSADTIVEELRRETDKLQGFARIQYMIDSGGPPVGRPITLRVVGIDDTQRKRLSEDIMAFLNQLPGVKDVDANDKLGKQQIEIKLDYDKLARVGVTVADVAQNVRIAYDGEVVTNVRYGDEDVDFRVIFERSARQDPDYLGQLQLPNSSGRLTPLRQLARLETGPGPATLYHYDSDRAIMITGDIDQALTTAIKVTDAVTRHFDVDRDYPGMRLVVGGEAEESRESLHELFIILGIAALGIYFLLVLLFNSLWQPLIVMMAIPFGIIGVIFAFAVHHEALGFLAMTGMIGLAGVVVNDSLVLVDHVNALRLAHPRRALTEVVAEATGNRLRAIILTTVSTVAGLLPLAYGLGGADPYMSPMALALGYGLLFATPLTLVLVPCLYLVGEDIRGMLRRDPTATSA